jgi:hypothetical protein
MEHCFPHCDHAHISLVVLFIQLSETETTSSASGGCSGVEVDQPSLAVRATARAAVASCCMKLMSLLRPDGIRLRHCLFTTT